MDSNLRNTLLTELSERGQAPVGRVVSWLRSPEKRLPVSCTVYAVKNDWSDILYSWQYLSKSLRYGAGCAINLEQYTGLPSPERPGSLQLRLSIDHPNAGQMINRYGTSSVTTVPSQYSVVRVADTMDEATSDGYVSIEESWVVVCQQLLRGIDTAVDLSALRAANTHNGQGLVSSGPVSFAEIYNKIAQFVAQPTLVSLCAVYSQINEVLRRGGVYRNGAVTLYVHYKQEEAEAYLRLDRSKIEWAKRALTVDEEVLNSNLLPLILNSVAAGDLFLSKIRYDRQNERLYSQVCMEIALKSSDTCALHHINLGALSWAELPNAFARGMQLLCQIHQNSDISHLNIYLPPEESRQVGLGVIGLANFLALHRLKYREFTAALETVVYQLYCYHEENKSKNLYATCAEDVSKHLEYLESKLQLQLSHVTEDSHNETRSYVAALFLAIAYMRAAIVAYENGMERAFTIAPTATSSFQYRDIEGFVTTPNIAPPIALSVVRDSQEFGLMEADYHPYAETAAEVGFDVYFRLASAFQTLMNFTGLAHAISFDVWDQQPVDQQFLQRWLESPLWTTYYRTRTLALNVVDKSYLERAVDVSNPSECDVCAG